MVFDQKVGDCHLSIMNGKMEWGVAFCVWSIDVGITAEKHGRAAFGISKYGRCVQWGIGVGIRAGNQSPSFNQIGDKSVESPHTSDMKECGLIGSMPRIGVASGKQMNIFYDGFLFVSLEFTHAPKECHICAILS